MKDVSPSESTRTGAASSREGPARGETIAKPPRHDDLQVLAPAEGFEKVIEVFEPGAEVRYPPNAPAPGSFSESSNSSFEEAEYGETKEQRAESAFSLFPAPCSPFPVEAMGMDDLFEEVNLAHVLGTPASRTDIDRESQSTAAVIDPTAAYALKTTDNSAQACEWNTEGKPGVPFGHVLATVLTWLGNVVRDLSGTDARPFHDHRSKL